MATWQIRLARCEVTLLDVIPGAVCCFTSFPLPAPARVREHRDGKRERSMTQRTTAPRCSSGVHCVAYPTLGEPAKLSSGNPGPRCFACEERRAASELEAHSANNSELVTERREEDAPLRSESHEQGVRICAELSCGRPAIKREGGAFVCREHAEVKRASATRDRRRASVQTCERGLRSALAADDERLTRTWSRSLIEAEARLMWAEADLRAAEERAQPKRVRR